MSPFVPCRPSPAGVSAGGGGRPAGEDGPAGSEPAAPGAAHLRRRAGGLLVQTQWQPWTGARSTQTAAGPQGRPPAGTGKEQA